MDEILKDNRFAHIVQDPRFRRIPKKERKVKIDKRFKAMFNDPRFKLKYSVDKRGRPVNTTSTEDLKRYYELDSSSISGDSSNEEDAAERPKENVKLGGEVNKKNTEKHSKKTPKEGRTTTNGFIVTPIEVRSKILTEKLIVKPEVSGDNTVGDSGADSDGSKDCGSGEDINDNEDASVSDGAVGSGDSDSDFEVGNEDGEGVSLSEKVKQRLQDMNVDYARGEGVLLSDSSSDESSDNEGEEEEVLDHEWGELDRDAGRTEEVTRRLALCNMDWDRVQADDLMVLFHSFLPKGGVIHSITVYPSEYGLQRMKEEDEKGPQELRELKEMLEAQRRADERREEEERMKAEEKEDEDSAGGKEEEENLSGNEDPKEPDEEGEEGSHYQMEKLRQYQLSRLKYYYAVLVCDSPQTANALYEECDGREYESTAARLDLRFIPDDMTFDQKPRETCTQLPNMKKYEPLQFINTALQQSKVHLTWDETDPRRKKLTAKIMEGKVEGVDESDLKNYLASSSGEEEEGEEGNKENAAAKYRALLQTIDHEEKKKKNDIDMEVTWGIGLKEKVDKKLKEGPQEKLTPFQQMVQKRRERLRAKREARKSTREQEESDVEKGEEGRESASSEDDIPSDVDINDAYFREEFENGEFEKPAMNGSKKPGKKNKKNKGKGPEESEDEESQRKTAELELLLMDEDDGRQHFSLKDLLAKEKKKKKKGKKRKKAEEEQDVKKTDDFQINVKDERFSALFTSHLYNIDPADPHYKKTEAMETLRKQRLKRKEPEKEVEEKIPKLESSEKSKLDPEMSVLVKNIKRKTNLARK